MDKINAAETAISKANYELFAAVKEKFPVGLEVKTKGLRDAIDCTVSGYGERGVLVLTIKKSGKTMSRHYSSTWTA